MSIGSKARKFLFKAIAGIPLVLALLWLVVVSLLLYGPSKTGECLDKLKVAINKDH